MARILLLLPCNPGVRLGDYMLGGNWRIVWRWIGDLVGSGIVDLASVDSCKPGIIYRGEEGGYRWCDVRPLWHELYARQPWRLEMLVRGLAEDLRDASLRYRAITAYINVKAYRTGLLEASRRTGVGVILLGPDRLSPLSYRSSRNLARLRRGLIRVASETLRN